jgi:hypothetical protein
MMKNLKAIIAIVGIAFCLSACPKKPVTNNADENSMNAAAPEANAAAENVAADNVADENAALGNASTKAKPNGGERTDTGPRGNPNG